MSGARPDTWMPVYIGDYLADTMHLTRDQHGGYMLLIFGYWRRGAPLPDDDSYLAGVTKASPVEWKKLRPVFAPFFIVGDGVWRHKRIDAELQRASSNSEERSKAGARGAAKRWQQQSLAIAEPMANASQNDAPSPSPEERKNSDADASAPNGAAQRPIDLKKAFWDTGKAFLAANGVGAKQAGELLGKWRRDHGEPAVIDALAKAESEGASDVKGFIEGCLRNGHGSHGRKRSAATSKVASIFDQLRDDTDAGSA